MLKVEDRNKNLITLLNDGTIELKLATENRIRVIGKIKDKILFVFRETKHLHYKTNSIGFNAALIENDFYFDTIELEYNGIKYLIPKNVLIDNSFYLHFKNTIIGASYELQKFLSVDIIKKYKK